MKQSKNIYDSVGIQAWTVANKKLYLHRLARISRCLSRTFQAYGVHIQRKFDFKVHLS
jgi:hypothetical protein